MRVAHRLGKHSLLLPGVLLAILFFGIPALAAETGTAAPAAPAISTDTPLSRQEAQQLLQILDDPQRREAFAHTLSLMARGLPVEGKTATPPASKTGATSAATAQPLSPTQADQDIGTGLVSLRHQMRGNLRNFAGLFSDLAQIGPWARHELSNPTSRQALFEAFTGAIGTVLVGLIIERLLFMALRKPLEHLRDRASLDESGPQHETENKNVASDAASTDDPQHKRVDDQRRQVAVLRFLARIPFVIGHFALKAIPVLGFLGIAYLATLLMPWSAKANSVTLTLACSYAIARGLYLVVETALAPRSPSIRLLPVSNLTAHTIVRWWNILVAAPAVIVCLSMLGQEFDMPENGTAAMIRGVVLVEHILIAAFIWRIRHIAARALQPGTSTDGKPFWVFVGAVGRLWWIPAMFLDLSLWIVWAAHLRGGYMWIVSTTGITVGILIASRVVAILAYGLQDRLFRISPQMAERIPDLQVRADRYYPIVRAILTGSLVFLTLLALTQAWGLPTVSFFLHNGLGSRLLGAVLTMIAAATIAVLIWESVNTLLNRQISHFQLVDQASRATRLRTVLPIIRTVLLALIVTIVTVTTLSQIGINVTPLLTGAGIMGAAIAFGSQSLVKDFITGFFMLVEDAIQVGDWVTTGGVSGTVENLSIRTVKVRDFNGDLHIIPFSSVSSIANTARGYNQLVIRQQVDLSEDPSRVNAIMSKAIADMRRDDLFGPMILSDYTNLGVDCSDSNGSTIIGVIRTAPMMKWKVQREFYRRIANPFAQAGIKFYTPTAYTTTPPDGPFHIVADGKTDVPLPEPSSSERMEPPLADEATLKAPTARNGT
ncbi:mechanosensitive ion channel family protein [Brytella acorum]|uniref:Mechanosensitive ion channel n=1 Tax=Brytella acorum TaxID=2959299 RepID=A0AA35XVT3_9PROT|nr:mechanosensitive ion channel domain-containing protein [Brytella acorum]CAI9120064.1 mechanosensitive ion channel [Brytella acorum]